MDTYDIIANQPVVIDNGSGVIKAGFAGDQVPRHHFSNLIGRPKHKRVMAGALEGDTFVGNRAQKHRGLLSLKYPMEHGIVDNWADMEQIWAYLYSAEELQTRSEEHPVLLTEAPLNPRPNRRKMVEIFFETFNVPALYVSIQAVLSLYSTGRTTGVVLDSGDGVTHSVPIYEGFALQNSVMRIDLAGRDVTRYLKKLLRLEGYRFNSSSEFEVIRQMKEQFCCLSIHSKDDMTITKAAPEMYKLPDGNEIKVTIAKHRAPELLFRPDLIGDEQVGIHRVLQMSVQKSDIDLRRCLYQNIVLSGGSTLFKGFGDRLLSEVKKIIPKDVRVKIVAPQERLYATWIGGSILASLDTFKKLMISKQEYNDVGMDRLEKRSF